MSLVNWNKDQILKLSIDYNKVDNDLTDFPVLINLTDGSGQNNYDCSDVFEKLNYTDSVDDDFTGNNNDSPNNKLWTNNYPNCIKNDKIHFNLSTKSHPVIASKYRLSGNFDIQVDYDLEQYPASDRWYCTLKVTNTNTGEYWAIRRNYEGGHEYSNLYYNGDSTWTHNGRISTNDTTGKLRLKRLNSTITGYYWHVSSWSSLGDFSVPVDSDVKVTLEGERITTTELVVFNQDNFKLNSGNVVWPVNAMPNRKKIAVVYPSVQEHYVTISGSNVLKSYTYGNQKQLYCEIERWDQTNKSAQLWVKVPIILSDQPTDIFLYYDETQEDNTSYVGDTGEWPAQQVWDDNFVGVWHMSQDPSITAPQILDSTSISKNGTSYGSMTSDDLIETCNSVGINFDGTDDYINCGYADEHDITDTLTLECVFRTDVNGTTYRGLVSRHNDPTDEEDSYNFVINSDNKLHLGSLGGNIQSTKDNWDTTKCYSVAGTYNNNGSTITGDLYIDGIKETLSVDNYDSMTGTSNNLVIGKNTDTDSFFDGIIKEVRVSNTVRSNSWIKTTSYSNFDNLLTFSSAGIYLFSGYVREYNEPVQRTVFLYNRTSGELIDKTTSDSNGYYILKSPYNTEHNIVCLDAAEEPDFNDLIVSKVTPTETL